MSKQAKENHAYDSILLSCFKEFLDCLTDLVKSNQRKKHLDLTPEAPRNTVTAIAVRCMAQLLVKKPEFNYRTDLIKALTRLMCCKAPQIAQTAQGAIGDLFINDPSGYASLEAIKAIQDLLRAKQYKVPGEVLLPLLSLHLTEKIEEGVDLFGSQKIPKTMQRKKFKNLTRKQKILRKEQVELDEALRKAESSQRKDIQTEMLKALFLLYFRILRKTRNSPLLPHVLAGLAKYSHLVNLELLTTLIQILRDEIKNPDLSLTSSLYCIITTFQSL